METVNQWLDTLLKRLYQTLPFPDFVLVVIALSYLGYHAGYHIATGVGTMLADILMMI